MKKVLIVIIIIMSALLFSLKHYENKITERKERQKVEFLLDSLRKEQFSSFSKLIERIEKDQWIFSTTKILINENDDNSTWLLITTKEQLYGWGFFNFVSLEFQSTYFCDFGFSEILSIRCDNCNKKAPKFFVSKTEEKFVSEVEEQEYVLRAINSALEVTRRIIKMNRVMEALRYMEEQERKGKRSSFFMTITRDSVALEELEN